MFSEQINAEKISLFIYLMPTSQGHVFLIVQTNGTKLHIRPN